MKIKVSEATNLQLDWMVAKCEGWEYDDPDTPTYDDRNWKPTVKWSQGGPIIEREGITVGPDSDPDIGWAAFVVNENCKRFAGGQTPLIAAMRCYVASRLGDAVDVPEELA